MAGQGRPVKRSVTIAGHATSLSLEPEFWAQLKRIAEKRRMSINQLMTEIDAGRGARGLSGAARVHVLNYLLSARE